NIRSGPRWQSPANVEFLMNGGVTSIADQRLTQAPPPPRRLTQPPAPPFTQAPPECEAALTHPPRHCPSVDPTARVGLGRKCKLGAPKYRRRNCRPRPLPDALEKQAPGQQLLFYIAACRFIRWFMIHKR